MVSKLLLYDKYFFTQIRAFSRFFSKELQTYYCKKLTIRDAERKEQSNKTTTITTLFYLFKGK